MSCSQPLRPPHLLRGSALLLTACLTVAWACAPPEEEAPAPLEEATDPMHELNQRLQNLSLRFENRLQELRGQIDELRQHAAEEGTAEASRMLEELEEAEAQASRTVNDFGAATGANWEQLEREAEGALDELERAYEETREKLAPAAEEPPG